MAKSCISFFDLLISYGFVVVFWWVFCLCVFLGPICYQSWICGILELWSFFFAADRFSYSAVVSCRRRCPKVAFLSSSSSSSSSILGVSSSLLFGESTVVLVRLCFHSRRRRSWSRQCRFSFFLVPCGSLMDCTIADDARKQGIKIDVLVVSGGCCWQLNLERRGKKKEWTFVLI